MKQSLLAVLPRGPRHAVSVGYLAARLETNEREIRAALENLVCEDHIPVCTLPSPKGSIYIATTPEELDAGIAHISAKAGALLKRKRALRMCREYLAYKPTLFEIGENS